MRLRRVLVVDDEEAQRRIYCRLLESAGHQTARVESSGKALEFVQNEHPKLIVADIAMPGMDGIQLYKALRRDRRTAGIPVMLMTGLSVPRSLLQAAAVGLDVNDIFVKGDDCRRFIGLASHLLRSKSPAQEPVGAGHQRVVVDNMRRRIWIDGREIPRLPSKRYDLLVQLLQSDESHSPGDLLRSVWPESDNVKIVGVSILRLRRDLQEFPAVSIETTSRGYAARLAPSEQLSA